jgi:hypothetical protein
LKLFLKKMLEHFQKMLINIFIKNVDGNVLKKVGSNILFTQMY